MRDLQEVVPIQDTLCSGIGAIEKIEGNLFRFWLYVLQTSGDSQVPEKVVVAKIVGPAAGVPDAVLQMIASINEGPTSLVPAVTDLN